MGGICNRRCKMLTSLALSRPLIDAVVWNFSTFFNLKLLDPESPMYGRCHIRRT